MGHPPHQGGEPDCFADDMAGQVADRPRTAAAALAPGLRGEGTQVARQVRIGLSRRGRMGARYRLDRGLFPFHRLILSLHRLLHGLLQARADRF